MGIVFKAKHPVFGRGKDARDKDAQERSPYYWWWEFLRRNERYLDCCRNGGQGELAALYEDFGDVSNDNFKAWWMVHGYRLFAEKPIPDKLVELDNPGEWKAHWNKQTVMVLAVPLNIPKRYLQGFFARELKGRHPGKPGRKAMSDLTPSTARYPLYRLVSVKTLKKQLAVYDEVMAKKRGEHNRTLAKIGANLNLVSTAMPSSKDHPKYAADKRAVMAASVSRMFKDAQNIVANTALGQFPNSQK